MDQFDEETFVSLFHEYANRAVIKCCVDGDHVYVFVCMDMRDFSISYTCGYIFAHVNPWVRNARIRTYVATPWEACHDPYTPVITLYMGADALSFAHSTYSDRETTKG